MMRKVLSAGIILIMLGTLAAPAMAATAQDGDIRVTKMVVEPEGPDLHFSVYYESSFFTRVFSIIFGAKVVQPNIERVFANFSNVSITSIDSNNAVAKVVVRNASTPESDGWYVYDRDTAFTSKIPLIEVHNADGGVVTQIDESRLPAMSSKMPATGKK